MGTGFDFWFWMTWQFFVVAFVMRLLGWMLSFRRFYNTFKKVK